MKIYPTYTSGNWINGTVIIDGLREYYSGVLERMRQLNLAYYPYELNYLTRVKPYENTPHIHKT